MTGPIGSEGRGQGARGVVGGYDHLDYRALVGGGQRVGATGGTADVSEQDALHRSH